MTAICRMIGNSAMDFGLLPCRWLSYLARLLLGVILEVRLQRQ